MTFLKSALYFVRPQPGLKLNRIILFPLAGAGMNDRERVAGDEPC